MERLLITGGGCMVLLQYANLLLHRSEGSDRVDVIGEDQSASNTVGTSDASDFEGVTVLCCQYKQLRALPLPADGFLNTLATIDLSHCANITRIPSEYGAKSTVRRLIVAGTKLSAVPFTMAESLEFLDVSNCRRMSDVGDLPRLHMLNVTASNVTDISATTSASLRLLIAFNSRLSSFVGAPKLHTMMWSSATPNNRIEVRDCAVLNSIVTTSDPPLLDVAGDPYIATLLV